MTYWKILEHTREYQMIERAVSLYGFKNATAFVTHAVRRAYQELLDDELRRSAQAQAAIRNQDADGREKD